MSQGPKIEIKGKGTYVAVVLKVKSSDEFGRPRELTTLYDEESTDVSGGEQFLIGFLKEDCIRPHKKGTA